MFYLGPYSYDSKGELKQRLKRFLAVGNDGVVANVEAQKKLNYLLLLHPRANEKIGVGVKEFKVVSNEKGSGKSFVVARHDGSEERFSYKACIDGQDVTNRSRAVEAFRFCVREQIANYRDSLIFPVSCAITGELIRCRDDLHVDHKVPFWLILREFCQHEGVDLNLVETRGNGELLEIVDQDVAQRFESYHRREANLQPTLKSANLTKGGRFGGVG